MSTSNILPQEIPSGHRRCTKCGDVKPATQEFFSVRVEYSTGKRYLHSWCRLCHHKYRLDWQRAKSKAGREPKSCLVCGNQIPADANPLAVTCSPECFRENRRQSVRAFYYRNQDYHKQRTRQRSRQLQEDNPDEWRANKRQYYARTRERRSQWAKTRRVLSPGIRLSQNISSGIKQCLGERKNGWHWEDLVGYTANDLRRHLESQWLEGMTWDNYGRTHINGVPSWNVDHIRPVSSFSFSSYDDPEFKECWALSNLQPLWETDNLRKSNKWTG